MRFGLPGLPEIQEAAMKYGMFGIMMPVLCGKVLIPYAKEKVPGFDKRNVMAEYKGMIARNPDIGTGKTNPLLAGLYLAAYILAFHKAYPAQIGGEEIGELVDILGESSVMKRLYAGKDFFTEKNIAARASMAEEPKDLYPENWKYEFWADIKKRECIMNYRACAICNMCRREGCFELLKYMCKIDFVSQELMGNTLIRTKTLAEGHEVCDFHIIGRQTENLGSDSI